VVAVAIAATRSGHSKVECTRSCSRRIHRVQKRRGAVYGDIHPESRNRRDPIVSVRCKDVSLIFPAPDEEGAHVVGGVHIDIHIHLLLPGDVEGYQSC